MGIDLVGIIRLLRPVRRWIHGITIHPYPTLRPVLAVLIVEEIMLLLIDYVLRQHEDLVIRAC